MESPREYLESKVASFAILDSLARAAAEDDWAENRAYLQEQRDRQRRMRFFRPQPPPPTRPSTAEQNEHATGGDAALRVIETPRRISSASHGVVKATQSAVAAHRGRLGALLTAEPDAIDGDTVIPDSTKPEGRASLLRRSDSTPLPPTGKRAMLVGAATAAEASPSLQVGAVKKRKRDSGGPKLRPEKEQVLKGFSFYYIPNNDIAPARRLRINKAREFGATWTRSVVDATHVVVDRDLEYKDVEKVLAAAGNGSTGSSSGMRPKVVNEGYPIDCIQFRAVLDCGQSKYRVAGQPVSLEAEDTPMRKDGPGSSEESTKSLQVKTKMHNDPSRWDYVPPLGTPLRSEESSQRNKSEPIELDDSQPIVLNLGEGSKPLEEPATAESYENAAGGQADELSSYIAMMQEFKDLPLDHDDDDETRSTAGQSVIDSDADEREASEPESARGPRGKRSRLRSGRKDTKFEDRFACNTAGELSKSTGNPNARTIEVLQSMADYYERVNDHWRLMGYRKAIATLRRQDVKVCTEEEAFRLPSIGRRLAQKIEEIVTTNKLQRLEYAEKEPEDGALQLFLGVYGAGTRQAQQWIAQGHRTLEDLAQRATLTASQRIGVEHYTDLNARMTRREVEALAAVVRRAAEALDPEAEFIVGGSYRRGAASCSDIDFIVTRRGTTSRAQLRPLLEGLVQRLEDDGFLTAALAAWGPWRRSGGRGGGADDGHGSMWHGCCVLPGTTAWRRIDFLLVPETEMGGALIYFTGDDMFNRSMRLLASRKGMRLNQRGLFRDPDAGRRRRGPGAAAATATGMAVPLVPVGDDQLVEGRSEKRIFEILGVRWREPHERWCR
ncbi:DNA repair protein rad8 [Purpureocillium lavendulum]|uniref:DNA polymerase lambda n=1 Tax=Purpureocillium lavendulum TaxID=1247861 RepID=A0AB34G3C3_9HYPO|nr:DNA repair protein rad8 [Purpureocillium lavendulum]